jgi:hypothetical protein
MLGTSEVVRALIAANPMVRITEDRVRWVLRRGLVSGICSVAGRLVWTHDDVIALAQQLGVVAPEFTDVSRNPVAVT